jgi:two-component system chemotaxis response regulator CheY
MPNRPTILVVDDQASTRTLIAEALAEDRPAVILQAANGEEAYRILKQKHPDVIVCDVQMQPVDGLSFLKKLRTDEDPAVRKIPVIIMTTTATREVVAAAHQSGAASILAKPISLAMLKARLDAALKG